MHINNIEADQQILFPFYQWAVELCTNKPDMNHRIVIKIQQRPASRRQIFSAMPLSNVQCPYSNIQSINAEVSAAHFISDESCTITLDPSNEFIWSQHAIGFNTVVMYALVNRNKKKEQPHSIFRQFNWNLFLGQSIKNCCLYHWVYTLYVCKCVNM